MEPGRAWRRLAAGLTVAAWVAVAGFSASAADPRPGADEPAPAGESPGPSTEVGVLDGVDLSWPSQAAFAGWPPDALLERGYWLPWSGGAFLRAALFDRPVLFVLTVSWNRIAQRMALETLSDPRVLRAINRDFIAVRVNADRRPDIEARYATGGWPVIALLNRDGNPMLSQANEAGVAQPITIGPVEVEPLLFLLEEGAKYHRKWGSFLLGVGEEWARREGETEPEPGAVDEAASDGVARWMIGNADLEDGGFGAAPKRVLPGLVEYAYVRAARQVPALADHAQRTVDALIEGPLFDRENGGIHRMSVAPGWGAIQYEKLLDRNAALIRELVFSLRLGHGEREARERALRSTVEFLLGTLATPEGMFRWAQIADPTSEDGGGWWTGQTDAAPPVDPLVLAGPNVEAGAALLRAGRRLDEPAWVAAGKAAIDGVLDRAFRPGQGVRHVVEPRPGEDRFLETQADTALFLLDAYESTGDARYLAAARDIVDFAANNLAAPGEVALRDRLPGAGEIGLLANPRRPVDANARIARAMLRLAIHGAGAEYRDLAVAVLGSFTGDLARFRARATEAALAVEESIRDPLVLRIEGPPDDPDARRLRRIALDAPWPWTVVATGDASREPRMVATFRGVETILVDDEAIDVFFERAKGLLIGEGGS